MTLRRDRNRRQKANPAPIGTLSRMLRGCLNCGHPGAHFVPPSMGDRGFYACESFCDECGNGRTTQVAGIEDANA